MATYIVFEVTMTSSNWQKEYAKPTAELVQKHGGRYLAASPELKRVEGDRALPTVVVILEFPDTAAAEAWYGDADYQPLIALRQTGSTSEAVLVPGLG